MVRVLMNLLKTRRIRRFCALAAVLLFSSLFAILSGPFEIHVSILESLRTILRGPAGHGTSSDIIWLYRIPRCLCACLIGAMLAAAGSAFQAILRNPLADPFTVGVSAGSAVGAAFAELAGLGLAVNGLATPAISFVCGMLALVAVSYVARTNGVTSPQSFLLAGVVVGSMLWSLIPLAMALAQKHGEMRGVMAYLIGSIVDKDITHASILAVMFVIGSAIILAGAGDLNLLTLGEDAAEHLGVNVRRVRTRLIVAGALLTAGTVSVAGMIAFVGLVAPHLARRWFGPDHRHNVVASMMIGAALLCVSDAATRIWLNDLPVGAVTSLIGAPIFCFALRRSLQRTG